MCKHSENVIEASGRAGGANYQQTVTDAIGRMKAHRQQESRRMERSTLTAILDHRVQRNDTNDLVLTMPSQELVGARQRELFVRAVHATSLDIWPAARAASADLFARVAEAVSAPMRKA